MGSRFGNSCSSLPSSAGPADVGSSEVTQQAVEDAARAVSKKIKRAEKEITKEETEEEVQLFSVNGPKPDEPSPFVDAAPEIHRNNPLEEAALVRKEQKIKVCMGIV